MRFLMGLLIGFLGVSFMAASLAQAEPFTECLKEKLRSGFQKSPCDYSNVEAQARRQCATFSTMVYRELLSSGASSSDIKATRESYGRLSAQTIAEIERIQDQHCPTADAVAQFPASIIKTSVSQ